MWVKQQTWMAFGSKSYTFGDGRIVFFLFPRVFLWLHAAQFLGVSLNWSIKCGLLLRHSTLSREDGRPMLFLLFRTSPTNIFLFDQFIAILEMGCFWLIVLFLASIEYNVTVDSRNFKKPKEKFSPPLQRFLGKIVWGTQMISAIHCTHVCSVVYEDYDDCLMFLVFWVSASWWVLSIITWRLSCQDKTITLWALVYAMTSCGFVLISFFISNGSPCLLLLTVPVTWILCSRSSRLNDIRCRTCQCINGTMYHGSAFCNSEMLQNNQCLCGFLAIVWLKYWDTTSYRISQHMHS